MRREAMQTKIYKVSQTTFDQATLIRNRAGYVLPTADAEAVANAIEELCARAFYLEECIARAETPKAENLLAFLEGFKTKAA